VSRAPAGLAVRPLLLEERQVAYLWGVLALASVLLRPLWLAAAPLLPPCAFRALTGVPCLSCGTTRAAVALLHGDLGAALIVNPLAALAGIAFVAGGAVAPLWAALGLPLPRAPRPVPRALRFAAALALLAGWLWVIVAQA